MIEGEARLEKAIKASHAKARDQKQRLLWTASTGASYFVDAVFLGLFVLAGTASATVFYFFVAGAAAVCAATYAVYATGLNLRFRDQNVIWPQTAAGVALHLTVVALAPQLAFPVLGNLFTVFAFAFIWLSVRNSILLCALSCVAAGAVLWASGARAGFAASTGTEVVLTWLCFSAILGRFLLLSVYANDMRSRLAEGRRKLAISLEQIQELVHYDELTRAFNRRTLTPRLEQERSRAERTGVPFSVALMDLDHFKLVNDTYGHGVGDEVLRTFAATVHATMRDTDIFGRYGGEEFLLILTATTPESVGPALGRVCAGVAACNWSGIAPGLAVTQSIGVAGFRKGENVGQLLQRADAALYEAKRTGRNRIVFSE
jgi:diguanylate cyclase (GGDEF)-like protein